MSGKWESRFDPRRVYGNKICEIGQRRPETVVLVADLAVSFNLLEFANACTKQFLNVGVAEQNMVGIAAGLALEGKRPWVNSIAPFATLRCCEQIRTDLCYNNLPAVIVSIMGGLSGAPLGATHYATDDVGVLRSFANMSILVPADQWELEAAMDAAAEAKGPVYLRLGAGMEPHLPISRSVFKIGRAFCLREGNDVSLIATGYLVHKALEAAEALEQEGFSIGVYDHPTIKPLDKESVIAAARGRKLVVSIEEHNTYCGLGSAVAEVMAEAGMAVPLRRLGLPDVYGSVGEREDLLKKYGLDAGGIVRTIRESLAGVKSKTEK
jgi:transketolase